MHHGSHRPLARDGDRLTGSGAVDMKGGVALSLALMRQLAERPELYAEVAVLLVNDEEWRTAPFIHAERFAGFDACLCFEGGERTAEGDEAVIVKRKAAATLRVDAYGRSSHSGSAPELGRSALLALTAIAQLVAGHDDPSGPDRLTAVPTILRSGDAFNVVPAEGELLCDLRADRLDAFDPVFAALPSEHDEVRLESTLVRAWPGLDSRAATADVLADAERAARQADRRLRARRRQRRQPHRDRRDRLHDRRPRPARGWRAHPGRVGERGVAPGASRRGARDRRGAAGRGEGGQRGDGRQVPSSRPLRPPAPPPGGPRARPAVRGAT